MGNNLYSMNEANLICLLGSECLSLKLPPKTLSNNTLKYFFII